MVTPPPPLLVVLQKVAHVVFQWQILQEDQVEGFIIVYIYNRSTSRWIMYWTVALYAKHGLLLMFGAFLAWETRKIYMPVLNDSKQIGKLILHQNILSIILL